MICLCTILIGCQNPFAPKLDYTETGNDSPISDQSTVDGVFINMRYAYTFKDTSIYGQILSDDFIFTYRNYDLGFDFSWGSEEEMKVTYGLFNNCERLDLTWNQDILSTIDSLSGSIVKSFNLTITFNPSDVIVVDGRVNLNLDKKSGKWKINRWIDESNF